MMNTTARWALGSMLRDLDMMLENKIRELSRKADRPMTGRTETICGAAGGLVIAALIVAATLMGD